jgi:hypothetical protein
MTQTLPVAYQVIGTRKQRIRADYVLLANNQVGFAVHNWDGKHLLVIDPILANSTYLGGDTEDNLSFGTSLTARTSVSSISSDSKQNVYITGTTTAIDFPITQRRLSKRLLLMYRNFTLTPLPNQASLPSSASLGRSFIPPFCWTQLPLVL